MLSGALSCLLHSLYPGDPSIFEMTNHHMLVNNRYVALAVGY